MVELKTNTEYYRILNFDAPRGIIEENDPFLVLIFDIDIELQGFLR